MLSKRRAKYMNLITISRITCCVVFLVFIGSSTNSLALGSKLHEIEYAVISAAINHGAGNDSGKIIIDDTTTGASVDIYDPAQSRESLIAELGTTGTALREWSRLNHRRYTLQSQISTRADHELLSQQARSELFNSSEPNKNWRQFKSRFPGSTGILRVSRPGIDDTTNSALIYMEFECGAKCGSGRLVNLVQSSSGTWNVNGATLLWITSPD